jgi:pantoate--beta-alanine ligase
MLLKPAYMIIFKHAAQLDQYLQKQREQQQTIGFVPTMGALHKGHLELIKQCRQQADITVCSIFVNPTQFNNPADYEKYPNTIEQDILQLEGTGTDILFLPSIAEMYPNGMANLEKYELGYLETVLEGQYRPGHFQGVCQVMNRLLTMVQPDQLLMGQKDYQQCMVVRKLIELTLAPVQLITCPTVREDDGLAMSSRNLRLLPQDRKKATAIYQCLLYIKNHLHKSDWTHLQQEAHTRLMKEGFIIDYVTLANAETLGIVSAGIPGKMPLVVLIAAFLHDVRLIDNMILND